MVIDVLILVYYKQGLRTIIETNLFDYIRRGIFLWISKDRLLYLIAFVFKNLDLVEYNYKIYNKELLTIIYNFE